ncbi:recombinase family protein, partial [Clostridium chromiireducens]|nr:recombinase family protein [Clostridium chromiireducens]
MIVSYLRISTLTKGVERQEYLLDKLGIKFDKKYIDKCTGKSKERPQL